MSPIADLNESPTSAAELLIVELSKMPLVTKFEQFKQFIMQHPGRNAMELRTPVGTVPLPYTTSLTPEAQPQISLLLGGATVRYEQEADLTAVGDGIDF